MAGNTNLAFDRDAETFVHDAADIRVSEYQEHLWLSQQQSPEKPNCYALAYSLMGDVDILKLANAVRTFVENAKDFDVRFQFDDDAVALGKFASQAPSTLPEFYRAGDEGDVISTLVAWQAGAWNFETDPPFRIGLFTLKDCVVLGLVVHRIMDESWAAEDILQGIGDAYSGAPKSSTGCGDAVSQALHSEDLSPIEWARRNPLAESVANEGLTEEVSATLARRYQILLDKDLITSLAGSALTEARILSAVAAGFVRFVCEAGGLDAVGLWLPSDPLGELGDGCRRADAASHVYLKLQKDMPMEDAAAFISQQIGKKGPLSALETDWQFPSIAVSWLTDPGRFLTLENVEIERVLVPVAERRPDLALSVGYCEEGALLCELLTGQALSPNIGAFLLECFTASLKGAPAVRPAISAAATPQQTEIQNSNTIEVPSPMEPASDIAAIILEEFREALGVPDMGPEDDFFDHGGHSLIATRIIGRLLSNHGIEIHFNTLFSYPTAMALAGNAQRVAGENDTDSRSGDKSPAAAGRTPLSLAQMSLWKAYSAFGFNEIFNIPFTLRFLGPVDEHVFQCAFMDVLERHPGLRTLFIEDEVGVYQETVQIHDVPRYKWFWTSAESKDADRHAEAGYLFDLAKELPFRLRFMSDPQTGEQLLSFLFHHIVLDEWSVNLMMDELCEAFSERAAGRAPVWKSQPPAFEEFALKQNANDVDDTHLSYWVDMLRGAPPPLPLFKTESQAEAGDGNPAGGWIEFKLDKTVVDGLYGLSRENNASLFNVAYAAIAASLFRLGASDDLVIGTSASGRTDPAFFDTVGYFTTLVAHRVRMTGNTSVADLIGDVKDTINQSLPHGEIPLDLVEEALGMSSGREHLFEVFVQIHAKNKLNGMLLHPDGRKVEFRQVDPEKHESLLGLQFEVMEEIIGGERSIRVLMSYRADRYGPETVERLCDTTTNVMAQFAEEGASRLTLGEMEITSV